MFALSQHDSRCCIPCSSSPVPQFNKDASFSSCSMGKQHIAGVFSAPIHWIGKTTSPSSVSCSEHRSTLLPSVGYTHLCSHIILRPTLWTRYLLPLGHISPAYAVGLFFIISPQRLIDSLIHGVCVCVCVCV